jgi:Tat protein translocase TatB subunit
MFNIGPQELLIILIVALVVVGPKRLPELGRTIGRGLNEFRKLQDEVRDMVKFDLGGDAFINPPADPYEPDPEPETDREPEPDPDPVTHSERIVALPDPDVAHDVPDVSQDAHDVDDDDPRPDAPPAAAAE